MFTIENVRILGCEVKDWELNGKTGKFYPATVRIGSEIFNFTANVDLTGYIDESVALRFEFKTKQPKVGNAYTSVRIVEVVE